MKVILQKTKPTSTSSTERVLHFSSKKTASTTAEDSDSSEDTPLEPALMDSEEQRADFLNRKYRIEDHVGRSRAEERLGEGGGGWMHQLSLFAKIRETA